MPLGCLLCAGFEVAVSPVALVRQPRELPLVSFVGGDFSFSFFDGWKELTVFRCRIFGSEVFFLNYASDVYALAITGTGDCIAFAKPWPRGEAFDPPTCFSTLW